jgi:phage terminase Nu1 subunit (DNA packaging protein)
MKHDTATLRRSPANADDITDTKGVCDLAHVTRSTVAVWRAAGLPCMRTSKRLFRYEIPKVLEWLREHNKTASPASAEVAE